MSFFSKVKSIASKGMKVLSEVKTAAVEYATAPSSNTSAIQSTLPPYKEIIHLAQQVLEIVDSLSQVDPYSLETDRRLHDSKIRLYVGRIIYLLQVESSNESLGAHNEEHEPSSPCIDIFVSSNFVAALITRGLVDKPRGCLPLVLWVIADILRSVSYPLLPLQSIYKPVSKLISNAMRYDAVHNNANLICSGGIYNKNEYSAYKRRIEISLNVLLSVIWRKISENPPILEYFIVSDSVRSEKKRLGKELSDRPSGGSKLTLQIDILTSLVTTLLKPRTSSFAQESLYISLYMRSATITHFVVNHTNLLLALINEVCKRFVVALDYLIESNTTSVAAPVARFASPLNKTEAAAAGGVGGAAGVSSVNGVESFMSFFKLCVTVYGLLLNNVSRELILQSRSSGSSGSSDDSDLSSTTSNSSPKAVGQLILDNYSGYFLHGTLHYCLSASSDVQLLSAYSLVRRLLLELRACEDMNGETDGPSEYSLLHVTTQFLCGQFLRPQATAAVTSAEVPSEEALLSGDEEAAAANTTATSCSSSVGKSEAGVDYLSTILTRCSSVNKPLSVSAVQLVAVLLSLNVLPTTINVCCNRSRLSAVTSTSDTSAAPTPQPSLTISMMMAGRSESVDHILNAFVNNLLPNIYQTYSSDPSTASTSSAATATTVATPARPGTTAGAGATLVSPSSAASITPPHPPQAATGSSLPPTASSQSSKIRVGAFSRYVDVAATHILSRLSGHLTDILDDHREGSGGQSSLFPALIDSAVGTGVAGGGGAALLSSHNALYELLLRKLSGFLTLKTDEQVSLSGLLQQYMGVLCILVITSTESASSVLSGGVNAKSCFGQVVEILQHLDVLFNSMKTHVAKLSNSSNKLAAMKKLLQNTALQRIDDHVEKKRQLTAASANNYAAFNSEEGGVEAVLPQRSVNRINNMINNAGSTHGGGSANSSSHGINSYSGSGAARRGSTMFNSGSNANSSSNTPTSSSHGGTLGVSSSNSGANRNSGGPYVAQQSAEYKYLEKEPPQVKQILETANYILELRAEMRAFVFAVQILKNQFIHVKSRRQQEGDDIFEREAGAMGGEGSDAEEVLDEESIADLADIDELKQMQLQINSSHHHNPGDSNSSGSSTQLQRTHSTLYGQGKRLTYWNNLEAKESDFLQEYEVLNSNLEELVANSSSIAVF